MPVRRKTFTPCNHRGFGAYCHRCAQVKELREAADQIAAKDKRRRMDRRSPKLLRKEADRLAA